MLSCLQIRPYVTVKCQDWYFLISSVTPASLALSVPYLRSSSDFWGSKGFWQRIQRTMKSNSCDRPASSVSESEIMIYNKLIKQISRQTSLVLYAFIHESSFQQLTSNCQKEKVHPSLFPPQHCCSSSNHSEAVLKTGQNRILFTTADLQQYAFCGSAEGLGRTSPMHVMIPIDVSADVLLRV